MTCQTPTITAKPPITRESFAKFRQFTLANSAILSSFAISTFLGDDNT